MQIVIFTKVNGRMAGNMEKETISIQLIKAFSKVIGKIAKKSDE